MFEGKSQEDPSPKGDKNQQWLNGIWFNSSNQMMYTEINGNKFEVKRHTHLDYPDMKILGTGTMTYGTFDEAKDEVYKGKMVLEFVKENKLTLIVYTLTHLFRCVEI